MLHYLQRATAILGANPKDGDGNQDVLAALEAVMRQGSDDPAAVKYWLMFASQPATSPPAPMPNTGQIPVEERDLHVYDGLIRGAL